MNDCGKWKQTELKNNEIARDQNILIHNTRQHKTKFRHLWVHTMCQGKNLSELTAKEEKPGDTLALKNKAAT